MDFPQPDPEQVLQAITNLKAAFQAAADNSTGASKPKFKKLSDAFNNLIDKTQQVDNPQDIKAVAMAMLPAIMQFQMAKADVDRLAKTDSAAAQTVADLTAAIQKEGQGLLGGLLGGLSGSFPTDIFGQQDQTPKPPIKKPRKPDSGDFDL